MLRFRGGRRATFAARQADFFSPKFWYALTTPRSSILIPHYGALHNPSGALGRVSTEMCRLRSGVMVGGGYRQISGRTESSLPTVHV